MRNGGAHAGERLGSLPHVGWKALTQALATRCVAGLGAGENGQDLVEYGLLAVFVAVVAAVGVSVFGQQLIQQWNAFQAFLASL